MSKNKTFLINNVENNLSVDTIADIVKNWKLVYPTAESALSGIVVHVDKLIRSATRTYSESDVNYIFTLVEKHLLAGIVLSDVDEILSSMESENITVIDRLNIIKDKIKVHNRVETAEDNVKKICGKIDVEDIIESYKMANCEKYCIDGVQELCHQISLEYSTLTDSKKMCICAEGVKGILDEAGIRYKGSVVLKGIVEYFLIAGMDYKAINEGLDNIKTYPEEEIERIEPEETLDTEKLEESDFMFMMQVPVVERGVFRRISSIRDNVIKRMAASKIVDSIEQIPALLYKTKREDIIEELPDLVAFARRVILYGSAMSLSAGLLLPAIIVDRLIDIQINRQNAKDIINSLEEEREVIMRSIKGRPKSKEEELLQLVDSIDSQITKVKIYMEGLGMEIYENVHHVRNNTDFIKESSFILAIGETIQEGSIKYLNENSLKSAGLAAKEKLEKAMDKMSSKEKAASRTLDHAIDKFNDEVRRSVELENRDRVIEGKILPSASKTIKIAIGLGFAWAVAPAIAVIGAIGSLAIAKNTRAREKQIILDDISMHLTIVEKKIYQAEMNNDTDAMEELMRIENTLKREKQRIEYNRKVYGW